MSKYSLRFLSKTANSRSEIIPGKGKYLEKVILFTPNFLLSLLSVKS